MNGGRSLTIFCEVLGSEFIVTVTLISIENVSIWETH